MRRVLILIASAAVGASTVHAGLWTSAYYAGWMQNQLPVRDVDFAAMTHVIHVAVVPRADGSLDGATNGVTSVNSTDVVTRAHAAGIKALICVGGENSAAGFRSACSDANRSSFVSNLVNFVRSYKY